MSMNTIKNASRDVADGLLLGLCALALAFGMANVALANGTPPNPLPPLCNGDCGIAFVPNPTGGSRAICGNLPCKNPNICGCKALVPIIINGQINLTCPCA